jgi:peptidoglycan-associated lipoprotein
MARRVWQIMVVVICLVLTSALLSGCASRKGPGTGSIGAGVEGAPFATAGSGGPRGTLGTGLAGRGGAGGGTIGSGPLGAGDSVTFTGTTIPALPSPSGFSETAALRDVHFDFDQYAVRPHDARTLEENARWLKANRRAIVLIEGHADERGTNEYNLALGERRAAAARNYLIWLGVEQARITVISYGEERPQCTAREESCWGQNRRAHFLVKP